MSPAEKMPWVIFDIDGTLADITHRLHHIKGDKKPDWDAFNAELLNDTLKVDIKMLYNMCSDAGYNIMIVTGREDKYKPETVRWLHNHGITFNEIHMRKTNDKRSDYIIKSEVYDNFVEGKRVIFVVDDRQRVVDMWREKGLTVLQCQKGDY